MVSKLPVGVFLHSLAKYDIDQDNLNNAIEFASSKHLNLIQLGPVSDAYLVGDCEAKRQDLVACLKENKVKVGPLCVCYESGKGRGGLEVYDEDMGIDGIVRTGGYGISDPKILRQRIDLTRDHVDLAAYLRQEGVMSSRNAVLTTHAGFFDRPDKREQIKNAVAEVLRYCATKNVYFGIETGSEPMGGLIEFIREVEHLAETPGRLVINYDPANFFLYGTQDPLEALMVLRESNNSKYLFGVHGKDANKGEMPGRAEKDWKGVEVPVGIGHVKWHDTLVLLHDFGYKGSIIVEREGLIPDDVEDPVQFRVNDLRLGKQVINRAQAEALRTIRAREKAAGGSGESVTPFG